MKNNIVLNGNGKAHKNCGHNHDHGYQNGHAHDADWHDDLGDMHAGSALDTPLRPDAFLLSDEQKMDIIEDHFRAILHTLGLDLNDDSLQGTPRRVAKMYVKEIFQGLNDKHKPKATLFDNKFQYSQMLVERDIAVQSTCEHHFLPIFGVAHVAYISSGHVIGLSKINRIVRHYSKRPQVQERLTKQIAEELKRVLHTEDVAVFIDARHMCVMSRGIEDHASSTVTVEYGGRFGSDEQLRNEFLSILQQTRKG